MDSGKFLGEFLRARRTAIAPARAGLPQSRRRRTTGLRREEVAMLVGISTDYYTRLEQGRERHPSEQVLGTLVRVLDLGSDAAAHLYELARPRSPQWRTTHQAEQVSPHLLQLIESWPCTAAIVCGRWMDVLAANPLATVLYEGMEYADNLLRLIFLDPAAPEFYRDWEQVARARVAHLRAIAGADLDDPALTRLVDEVAVKSTDFRELWAHHDVSFMGREDKRFHHRDVGDLDLTCELFNVIGAPGQQLITIQAEPDSPSVRALPALNRPSRGPVLVPAFQNVQGQTGPPK